jgi:hypothetical protein
MARVVRKAWNVAMVGVDHHGGLYYFNLFTGTGIPPGPPVPWPPGLAPVPPVSFHAVATTSAWPLGEDKSNPTVLAEGDPIVSKNHESKKHLHIPPGGNLLIPITLIFSASKWMLGVGSVQATNKAVAATMAGPIGANYNCQDPCSCPFPNVMTATSTVHVEASAGDWAQAVAEMVIQSALEFAISFALGKGPDAMKGLINKFGNAALKEGLEKLGVGAGKYLLKPLGAAAEKAGEILSKGAGKLGMKEAMEKLFDKTVTEETEKAVKEAAKEAADKEIKEMAESGGKIAAKDAVEKAEKASQEAAAKKTEDMVKKYVDAPAEDVGKEAVAGGSGDVVKDQANSATEAKRQQAADAAGGAAK